MYMYLIALLMYEFWLCLLASKQYYVVHGAQKPGKIFGYNFGKLPLLDWL